MAETAEPEAGTKQAATSAALFGGALWLWAMIFFLELCLKVEVFRHQHDGSPEVSLFGLWVQDSFVLVPRHLALLGSLAVYALWQRQRDFGAAMARVMFYALLAAGLLLFALHYLQLVNPLDELPLATSCRRHATMLTFSVLGTGVVSCALYAHWRSWIAPWILLATPFWHALAAVMLYPAKRLQEEATIMGGLPALYPGLGHVAAFIVITALLAAGLVWSARRWRAPPDRSAALLMAGLAGLFFTTFVLAAIQLPWINLCECLDERVYPGRDLANNIVYWSFIAAEAVFIYLIWRHHRSEGVAEEPSAATPETPQHPAPPLD